MNPAPGPHGNPGGPKACPAVQGVFGALRKTTACRQGCLGAEELQ